MTGFRPCPSFFLCLICLLATNDYGQAFLFSSSDHAHNETAENNYVDPQLLKTRNGVTSGKKMMFITKTVFVPRGIRHLFYDIDDNPLLSVPDGKYDEVTVCTGRRYEHKNMRVLVYNNFICPDAWDTPLASYGSLLNEDTNAKIYCCRKPNLQDCCDKKRFYLIHGSLNVTNMELTAILVGCMIFFAIVVISCICCMCSCKCVKDIFIGKGRQKTAAKGADGSHTAAAKDYGATGYYKPAYTSSGSDYSPPGPGYKQPAPPSKPGYGPPGPGYGPPGPGYSPPGPGYSQPGPGYSPPGPGYSPPGPGYGPPAPGYGQPAPGYGQPAPGNRQSAPGNGQAGPGYELSGPGNAQPEPTGIYGQSAAGYDPSGPGNGQGSSGTIYDDTSRPASPNPEIYNSTEETNVKK